MDGSSTPASKNRILLVEDDRTSRFVIKKMLMELGCRVDSVANGREAVAACATGRFDVVLMDLNYTRDTTSGEEGLDLLERISGGRMLYNYMVPGGVRYDVPKDNWEADVIDFITMLEDKKLPDYNNLLSYNKIFAERLGDVAVISPETAFAYGCTGPVLRGSGVKFDTRKDDPYSLYHKFDWDVPVGKGEMGTVGDCWDRYWVRMVEMEQSVKIIEQALESFLGGEC